MYFLAKKKASTCSSQYHVVPYILLFYRHFNDGKKHNPNVKTILSLGGRELVHDMAFRTLHTKDNSFQTFAKHAVGFLRDKGFDGLNIHWHTQDVNSIKVAFPKLIQVSQVFIVIH